MLLVWLAKYDLYPLLSLNFFFRFAFAAYKSIFAFFCAAAMAYKAKEVGLLLSGMGIAGIFVQGVLVRMIVPRVGEGRTLFIAMMATSAGFGLLSTAGIFGIQALLPALGLIAVGYGLAVPCLSALFAGVPVEQGIMQGIAGAIDRFGQAVGPIVGGAVLESIGEANLMRATGVGLAAISTVCLSFIGEGVSCWSRGGYSKLESAEQQELQPLAPSQAADENDAEEEDVSPRGEVDKRDDQPPMARA